MWRLVPWTRLIIAGFMVAEAATLRWDSTPAIHQIGDGWGWSAALVAGAVAVALTWPMRPGLMRAIIGAVPPAVEFARAYAAWESGAALWGGAVGVRVSLGLLMLRVLGWSTGLRDQLHADAKSGVGLGHARST